MNPNYAGFWLRFVAHIVDSLILSGVMWGFQIVIFAVLPFASGADAVALQIFNLGLYACIALPYYVWGHYRYGTTFGKLPLGIVVVDAATQGRITLKQSIIRFASYLVSYLPLSAGFIMAGVHPR